MIAATSAARNQAADRVVCQQVVPATPLHRTNIGFEPTGELDDFGRFRVELVDHASILCCVRGVRFHYRLLALDPGELFPPARGGRQIDEIGTLEDGAASE